MSTHHLNGVIAKHIHDIPFDKIRTITFSSNGGKGTTGDVREHHPMAPLGALCELINDLSQGSVVLRATPTQIVFIQRLNDAKDFVKVYAGHEEAMLMLTHVIHHLILVKMVDGEELTPWKQAMLDWGQTRWDAYKYNTFIGTARSIANRCGNGQRRNKSAPLRGALAAVIMHLVILRSWRTHRLYDWKRILIDLSLPAITSKTIMLMSGGPEPENLHEYFSE